MKRLSLLVLGLSLIGCGQLGSLSNLTGTNQDSPPPISPAFPGSGLFLARRDAGGRGSQTQGAVSGDFTGDGLPDVVVPSFDDNLLNVYINRGGGFFREASVVPVPGDGTWAIACGDVDGDQRLDLLVTQLQSDRLAVLLGDGGGGFGAPVFTDSPGFPTGAALADFTGDGKLDAAVCLLNTGVVNILPNGGSGSFLPPIPLTVGSQPSSLISADFNGDGKADPLVGRPFSQSITLVLSQGSGHAPAVDYADGATSPMAFDCNNDGRPDLAGLSGQNVVVRLNQGNGVLGPVRLSSLPEVCEHLASTDLDGDGRPDLVATSASGSLAFPLLGDGQGNFSAGQIRPIPCTPGPQAVLARDFNGDRRGDAAIVGNTGELTLGLLLGRGNGSLFSALVSPCNFAINPVVSADFNGDGKMDMAMGGFRNTSLGVSLGLGDGRFRLPFVMQMAEPVTSVSQADLNRDGLPDLVSAQQLAGTVAVTLSRRDGFNPPQTYSVDGVARQAVCADFQGGGPIDVAAISDAPSDPAIALLRNAGDGSLSPNGLLHLPASPRCLGAGDLSGRGRADLVVGSGPNLYVLLNQGNGSFGSPIEVSAGREFIAVQIHDLDNDGDLDVAALNQDAPNHTVELLRNEGKGQLVPWQSVPLPAQPGPGFAVSDLNFDGLADLVVPLTSRLAVAVYLGRAAGRFDPPFLYGAEGAGSALSVADFDGDGRPDIATGDSGGSGLRVLLQSLPGL